MKKSKKILSLNKLTISKLNNSTSIIGGNGDMGGEDTISDTVGTIFKSKWPFFPCDTNPEMCL